MDVRNSDYEDGLRKLRCMLLIEGIVLLVLSLFFVKINGFIYVFVMMTSIFLFFEIDLKHTYQVIY